MDEVVVEPQREFLADGDRAAERPACIGERLRIRVHAEGSLTGAVVGMAVGDEESRVGGAGERPAARPADAAG